MKDQNNNEQALPHEGFAKHALEMQRDPSDEIRTQVDDMIVDCINLVGASDFIAAIATTFGECFTSTRAAMDQQTGDTMTAQKQLVIAKANCFGHAANVLAVAASMLDGLGVVLTKRELGDPHAVLMHPNGERMAVGMVEIQPGDDVNEVAKRLIGHMSNGGARQDDESVVVEAPDAINPTEGND